MAQRGYRNVLLMGLAAQDGALVLIVNRSGTSFPTLYDFYFGVPEIAALYLLLNYFARKPKHERAHPLQGLASCARWRHSPTRGEHVTSVLKPWRYEGHRERPFGCGKRPRERAPGQPVEITHPVER